MGGRRCCWLPKVPDIDTGVMSKWMPPIEHDIPEAIDCGEQRPHTVCFLMATHRRFPSSEFLDGRVSEILGTHIRII